jgi:hypothetical protein
VEGERYGRQRKTERDGDTDTGNAAHW